MQKQSWQNQLVDLFKASTITQAILALIIVITASATVISGHAVPDWYLVIAGTVIGHYFRAKQDVASIQSARRATIAERSNPTQEPYAQQEAEVELVAIPKVIFPPPRKPR